MFAHQSSLWGDAPCPQPGMPGCDPGTYEHLTGRAGANAKYGPRPKLLPPGFGAGASLSFDYLHYQFEKSSSRIVGAEQFNRDATVPFLPDAGLQPVRALRSDFTFDDVPGVRATIAMPLPTGGLELAGWAFEQADDGVTGTTSLLPGEGFLAILGAVPTGVAIPLLDQGSPGTDSAIIFDALGASTKTELMGARIDYVLDPLTPSTSRLQFSPTIGFQYMRLRETFDARGPFTPTGIADPDTGLIVQPDTFTRLINARIDNHLFAPTLGARFEIGNDYLSLLAEPKLAIAANRRRSRLITRNLGDQVDLATVDMRPDATEDSDLEPYFELNLKADVRLTQRLRAHVGYNLLVLQGIGRPQDALLFNSLGAEGAALSLRDQQTNMVVQGLFVGGEVLLGPMP